MPEDKDPFAFDEPDDDGDKPGGGGENKNFVEVRSAYNRSEKALKKALQQNEELVAFRDEVIVQRREQAIASAFAEAGLNPAQAKLYASLNPDATPETATKEAVSAFAAEYGLAAGGTETDATPAAPAAPTVRTTVVSVPASAGIPSTGILTQADWVKLSSVDSAAAQRAWQEGRVDLSGLREGLGPEK